jgi:nicotinamidase-related amidase
MGSCLLLVDIQNDYFPGGSMELVGIRDAAANAQALLKQFRKAQLPVVHVQHIAARPDATFFLPETPGSRIHELVAPLEGESVVVKHFPNSFRHTSLQEILKGQGIYDLVVCGAMSHMCIDATVRAAFDFGFNCTVAEDACAARDLVFRGKTIKAAEVHASFMAALAVPYAEVIQTREMLGRL